jgi:CheY-like chemotaxis protein
VRILLVEDTPTNQKVVLNQLKMLGYEADCAVNGREALNLLTRCLGLARTEHRERLQREDSEIEALAMASQWDEVRIGEYPHVTPELYADNAPNVTNGLRSASRRPLGQSPRAAALGQSRSPVPALTPSSSSPYDIVLMDCQMPIMDGYEATQHLRAFEGASRRTVVIAMTANALVGDREKCLAADMDDYISKPVRLEELEQVLERWLPPRVKESASLGIGEPEFPSGHLSIATSQNSQHLTPNDYHLSSPLTIPPSVAKPANEVPVDLERLSELSRGDTEFLKELLQVFLEDALIYLEELENALAAGDCTTLARRAHQLKGSSATVAIYKMPEIAAQLERQAEDNQLLGASDLLAELEQILERIQAFISDG